MGLIATAEQKKVFSIKIPTWDQFESEDYKLARFPFGLACSTIATTASAFVVSEERSNLQWNCPMTSRWKIIVPRDTADSFVKS